MTADLRQQAQEIFAAGVAAADPFAAATAALADKPLDPARPVLILAVGKAAGRMASAALQVAREVGATVRAIVVTNYENAAPLEGATVMAAGHPVPDEAGARAAEAVIAALESAPAGSQILALISGGGSALLPAPVAGVSLEEKAEVSRMLLGSGADITTMNLVRQQLSRLKGGGLLRLAAPAKVRALILSDVVGDDLSAIASGPTAPPLGTAQDARAALEGLGLWDSVPASVRAHLQGAADPGPLPGADNQLVGSNGQSLAAMAAVAHGARVLPDPVTGDVAEAARLICDAAGPGITLWGGETTVVIRGDGKGGRNQELALRIALEAEARGWPQGWVCLQGGTDGRDGPTDAAGGLVDAATLARLHAAGIDPHEALARNDSYSALRASGDLLMTGATGTNVADLGVLIRPQDGAGRREIAPSRRGGLS
jgi:glycerate 2-kinase